MHNVEDNADLLANYLDSTYEKNLTFNSMSTSSNEINFVFYLND